jgi:hypothetical protein
LAETLFFGSCSGININASSTLAAVIILDTLILILATMSRVQSIAPAPTCQSLAVT